MVKRDDLVMYITSRIATYLDTPREERKRQAAMRVSDEQWSSRWFGLIPFATKMMVSQLKVRRKKRPDHG